MNSPSPNSSHPANSNNPDKSDKPDKPPRTLLITGASRGIGAKLAQIRQARGDTVLALSRHRPSWDLAPNCHHIPFDLNELSKIDATMQKLIADFPHLDAVVSNAGNGHGIATLEQLNYAQIEASLRLNLHAHIHLSRSLWVHLKTRSPAHLVFVGSEAALAGAPSGAIYCAAKFGLRGFAQSLRAEARRSDLAVSIVHPGPVRSSFFDELNFAPGPDPKSASEVDSVAEALSFIIDSRVDSVIDEIVLSPRQRNVARKRSTPRS